MMRTLFADHIRTGLILGLIAPLLGLIGYYFWKVYPNTWGDFLRFLTMEKRLLSSITVICLLMNVILFTIFVNTKKDQSAKGIFGITLIYAIASLMVKFLL